MALFSLGNVQQEHGASAVAGTEARHGSGRPCGSPVLLSACVLRAACLWETDCHIDNAARSLTALNLIVPSLFLSSFLSFPLSSVAWPV